MQYGVNFHQQHGIKWVWSTRGGKGHQLGVQHVVLVQTRSGVHQDDAGCCRRPLSSKHRPALFFCVYGALGMPPTALLPECFCQVPILHLLPSLWSLPMMMIPRQVLQRDHQHASFRGVERRWRHRRRGRARPGDDRGGPGTTARNTASPAPAIALTFPPLCCVASPLRAARLSARWCRSDSGPCPLRRSQGCMRVPQYPDRPTSQAPPETCERVSATLSSCLWRLSRGLLFRALFWVPARN